MEITIHDANYLEHISPVVNGEQKSHGLIRAITKRRRSVR